MTACADADVILLGPKPYMVKDILAEPGMKEALEGKLLISICAGVTKEQIEGWLYGEEEKRDGWCTVVRAMPNTASGIRESMTVVATSVPALPEETSALITWIFKRIGDVVYLPASNVSTPSTHTLFWRFLANNHFRWMPRQLFAARVLLSSL